MDEHALGEILPIWSIAPFGGLLLAIAILPLSSPHFWESNRNKAIVSAIFGVPVAIWIGIQDLHELAHTSLEYFSFISLLASLFVVSGGILLTGDIRATPRTNTAFFLLGSILANFIGTTGASMLLIRPLIRINRERRYKRHVPIFFTFLVSNIGGCLLPIGDPPLFMGYLKGVPFFWTLRLTPQWAFAIGTILAIFYVYDSIQWRREPDEAKRLDVALVEPLRLHGNLNFVWLLGVLLSVIFLRTPLREFVMFIMASLSMITTPKEIRNRNEFNFHPIIEVAVIFAGIFATMIPPVALLRARGYELGISQPWHFFWLTGSLSTFLDNTPTYVTFFALAQGVAHGFNLPKEVVGMPTVYLEAISCGAVFMGANSYIGNAPNFMVKAICDKARLPMPSFLGYMLWAAVLLLPIFAILTLIFFT